MNVVEVDAGDNSCHACGSCAESMYTSGDAMCSLLCSACLAEAQDQMKPRSDSGLTEHQRLIAAECDALKAMLLQKNRDYGSSALDPVRIFSKADPVEQILVRLDDKLSRIARGQAGGEDAEWDATGYLVLLRVARKLQGEKR